MDAGLICDAERCSVAAACRIIGLHPPRLVHRGVQKIHAVRALVWLELRNCEMQRQERLNFLYAPVH